MKKLAILLVMLMSTVLFAQNPRTIVADDWEEISRLSVKVGTPTYIGNFDSATLFIATAVATTTANTGGIEIIVQVNPTDDDDFWITQASFTLSGGTSVGASMGWIYSAASDVTKIQVNSTLGTYDDGGPVMIFLENETTVANSELCMAIGYASNTSITVADVLTNTPAASSTFWDLVHTKIYPLPKWAKDVRVIYDNTVSASPTNASIYTKTIVYGTRP